MLRKKGRRGVSSKWLIPDLIGGKIQSDTNVNRHRRATKHTTSMSYSPKSPSPRQGPPHYSIKSLKEFRNTPGVQFHTVPMRQVRTIHSVERVIHAPNAISPDAAGDVERTWYMHPHQEDNLMVFVGERTTELYNPETKSVDSFLVRPDRIEKNGEILFDGPAILSWPNYTFHRITSGPEGSVSLNLAHRLEGFDINTEFNIYDLDFSTGEYRILRVGSDDQIPSPV
eukprot:gnl/Trimastix_PCT/2927.p1 GENE.gnl/Trimastix_PCT/2927~~gnl/Trimastix_PCT/2927.p1  ORF type:complete len:254 (+),score=16.16 gnl/Trimastix_PCT/2927:83-763(+)